MTTYAELAEDMQDLRHVKIANNTYAHRVGPDLITISLHGSDILTLSSAGTIGATDAGWPTLTTVKRLNAFTPDRFLFTRKNDTVHVIDRETDDSAPLCEVEYLDPAAGLVRMVARV